MVTYEVILIRSGSRKILARFDGMRYRLPQVYVQRWARPAEELQKAIRDQLGQHVIVLELSFGTEGSSAFVVAELISEPSSEELLHTESDWFLDSEFTSNQRAMIEQVRSGQCGPFSRIGWLDEAVEWLCAETGKLVSSRNEIKQYNVSGTFSLLRVPMEDGSAYWMKATGEPNAHEYAVTRALAELCPESLPILVGSRPDWNCWITEEAGQPLTATPSCFVLQQAVVALAELQKGTVGLGEELLAVGVMDQRLSVLQQQSDEMFDYLEEVMSQQITTAVPRLERQRLREIEAILRDACSKMMDLGIADTVIHGDLNRGNILFDGQRCRFTDWSETYIGNPFISLQHLLLLNTDTDEGECRQLLKEAYKHSWTELVDPSKVDAAFTLMPLLALSSYLYGRGDWLRSPHRNDSHRQRYARSLARHMDRAAKAPELLGALCL